MLLWLETNGVLSSPNFDPRWPYPNNLDAKQTIQVEEGKAIRIHFTYFHLEPASRVDADYVAITEGDGSPLASIRATFNGFGLKDIAEEFVSKTNAVNVLFHTGPSIHREFYTGWRLIWGEFTGFDFFN